MIIETVKIKPSSPEQGDFVLINKSDFNATVHELFDDESEAAKPASKADLQAALDEKGIAYKPAASKADLQALLNAKQIA